MRIAVISTLSSGGATIAAQRITKALVEIGHDCSFFTLDGSDSSFSTGLADAFPLNAQNDFWTNMGFRRWSVLSPSEALVDGAELFSDTFLSLHAFPPLPEDILDADVVHLHWMAGTLFSPALLHALKGKKIVWTLHDMNPFTGGCHYHPTCRKFETHCGECPLLRLSGRNDASWRGLTLKKEICSCLSPSVVTPSVWLTGEAQCSAIFKDCPATTIIHPFDTAAFAPQDRLESRQRFGLRPDAFFILLGADHIHNTRKNCGAVHEALRILASRHKNLPIEVLTFGHGAALSVPYPVHHLGYLRKESEMAAAYSAADVFVHTSLMDALTNTLCEAQCCGTPVISYASGGCVDTMVPGQTGFLTREQTPQALAEILEEICVGGKDLTPMKEAARAFAVEKFSTKKIAQAYTQVFHEARSAPGLEVTSQLYASLVQNQIASLAVLVRSTPEGYSKPLMMQLEEIRARLHNLRHPLRWLWRKLRTLL